MRRCENVAQTGQISASASRKVRRNGQGLRASCPSGEHHHAGQWRHYQERASTYRL